MIDAVVCAYCGSPWQDNRFYRGRCDSCGGAMLAEKAPENPAIIFGVPLHEGGFEMLEARYGPISSLEVLYDLCVNQWSRWLDVRIIPSLIRMVQARYD